MLWTCWEDLMVGNRDLDQVESDLINEIEKCRRIYDGLNNNDAYKELVADFKHAADEIDSVWHLQPDINKLQEMRITKFAAQSLINALDGYKGAMDRAKAQL